MKMKKQFYSAEMQQGRNICSVQLQIHFKNLFRNIYVCLWELSKNTIKNGGELATSERTWDESSKM